MRPRSTLLLLIGGLALLLVAAAWLGRRPEEDTDIRPSTFLTGPGGSRALLDATLRLGVPVQRFRGRPRDLAGLAPAGRSILLILSPTIPLSAPEIREVLDFGAANELVLAGKGAEPLMRCFGYRVNRRMFDSSRVARPGPDELGDVPWVHATLIGTGVRRVVDSSRTHDVGRIACEVPTLTGIDTLLRNESGRLVAVRLRRGGAAPPVILVSDEELFRNRTLRRTWAGPYLLGLVAAGRGRVLFDEFHHGFGPSGSLAALTLAWSARSPWGWLAWQIAIVGLLALLFGAVRFGPARPGIPRVRRSPLEHLRALAHALAAARGHDVAIAAIVRGLRRRLTPPGLRARSDWREWLAQLGRGTATPRAGEALGRIDALTRPGQPPESVLRAANAVEDLWQELRPSRPTK